MKEQVSSSQAGKGLGAGNAAAPWRAWVGEQQWMGRLLDPTPLW